MSKLKELLTFLNVDLWRIRLEDQPAKKSLWIRMLRIFVLSIKGFDKDNCMLRASALTFYTLLSIVPVLAMAFGVAKGFGFDQILEQRVREQFQGQEEVIVHAITFARNLLDNTKGGLIAGVGIVFLIWSVIKVLGHMERSFNHIWGIKNQRSWARKFSDYFSLMLIGPLTFLLASSMTVMVTTRIESFFARYHMLALFADAIELTMKILPFGVVWGLFAFTYVFLPNGKVSMYSSLIGGILAGTIYQLVQWGYITFQLGMNRYNAIYGSFAALPLFLVWLQLSWLIVLYGAEVAFAHQNVETYEFESDCLSISPAFERLVTLAVAHLCVSRFGKGEPPPSSPQISKELQTPIRLVKQTLFNLVGAGVLSEVTTKEEGRMAYQPATDIHRLTLQGVNDMLDNHGSATVPLNKSDAIARLSSCLVNFRETLAKSSENILLKDL